MYRAEVADERAGLTALALSESQFIEAVAAFDRIHSRDAAPGGWFDATMGQVRTAHQETISEDERHVELVRLQDDELLFLIVHPAHAGSASDDVHTSEYRAVMRTALAGESGAQIIEVHQGEPAIVAYRPVRVPEHDLAIAVSMSLADVRGPFLTAGLLLTGIALLLTGVGSAAMWRYTEPAFSTAEESERRYRQLFEEMREGFALHEMIWDRNGRPVDYRFLDVNPAFEELTGLSREIVLGSTAREVIPDLEPLWIQRFANVVRSGEPITFEAESAGLGRWYRVSAFSPEPNRFGTIFQDVTERRALEDQLRQAQKMEAVGQLVGGIAHDFNNVLSVILMNSEIMAADLESGRQIDPADMKAVREAAAHADGITRKLLGFSRRATLDRTPADLSELVREFLPLIRTVLPETITMETSLGEGDDLVLVDPGSVEQMLMNLATNARDAMPDGGVLRIGITPRQFARDHPAVQAGVEPGRFLCVEVSDTGTGMDDATVQKAFEPFFTTKEHGSGTGLGLAMVYGLTRQQGGHASLESDLGSGTTIRLFLPVHDGQRPENTVEAAVRGEAAESATILVVEDEAALLKATRRALERKGHTVLTAEDGVEAMAIFDRRADDIDLVLSDYGLPNLGGIDLLKGLRSRYGPVRFILASGYGLQELSEEERHTDTVMFLAKPWTLTELLDAVRTALEKAPA